MRQGNRLHGPSCYHVEKIPFLERIVAGEKVIESRWYSNKRIPWDKVHVGEWIYFKNVGELVSAKAKVVQVRQFAVATSAEVKLLVYQNATALGLDPSEIGGFYEQVNTKRFVIFLDLTEVTLVTPFAINKTGFGAMAAWLTVPSIAQIKKD